MQGSPCERCYVQEGLPWKKYVDVFLHTPVYMQESLLCVMTLLSSMPCFNLPVRVFWASLSLHPRNPVAAAICIAGL